MPNGMNNGHERLLNEAIKSLDKVDEQLNLARENISRAAYHNGKARKALLGLGGLPSVAFSVTGFALIAFAGWSGFRGMTHPDHANTEMKESTPVAAKADASVLPVTFVGSKETGLFHLPGCVNATKIKEDDRLTFPNADDARSAGLKICPICGQKH